MTSHKKPNRITNLANQALASVKTAKVTEKLQWRKYRIPNTGHGFAAEDANTLHDTIRGNKVTTTGQDNVKDGPDRVVNGIMIQTKYYKTAAETVSSAFDKTTGTYRYKNQVLEVPKDQYAQAVELMKEKIKEGKVPGVTDPEAADNLVREGSVTYQQARNIAKAGNIDSLLFDLKTQSVTAAYAFGISFAVQYANCRWSGMDREDSLKLSITAGMRTGTIALGAGVVGQQFLRTAAGRNFATYTHHVSKRIIDQLYSTELGKKIIHKLASIMLGKNLTGAAAKNALIRLLRTNIVTSTVTTVAISLPDFYRALVSEKISWQQFAKNVGINVAGISGGLVGSYGGTLVGSAVGGAIGTMIAPGPGTVTGMKVGATVGGIAGGVSGGMGGALGSKKLLDLITEDDAVKMYGLVQEATAELAFDYMVTEAEFADQIAPKISPQITPKWLELMYQAGRGNYSQDNARSNFAYQTFEPIFAETIQAREKVYLPSEKLLKREVRKTYWLLFKEYLTEKLGRLFGRKSELLPD